MSFLVSAVGLKGGPMIFLVSAVGLKGGPTTALFVAPTLSALAEGATADRTTVPARSNATLLKSLSFWVCNDATLSNP